MCEGTMSSHVVILGAGITGLSAAWYLKKKLGAGIKITLVEKDTEVGGWIRSIRQDGFLFEKGPRGCRQEGAGIATLSLVQDIGLEDQLIGASPQACRRFIWKDKQLQAFPHSFASLLFSRLGIKACGGLIRDRLASSSTNDQEESVRAFCTRRFGKVFTETFVEPMILGIYAGDDNALSIQACFPKFYELEHTYGSVLKGILRSKKQGIKAVQKDALAQIRQKLGRAPLFSFKNGMQTLPRALAEHLSAEILLGSPVQNLCVFPDKVEVVLPETTLYADHVISTLPAAGLSQLLSPYSLPVERMLKSISYSSVNVISMGFKEKVLSCEGFGYLIPSIEGESILGMVWDSSVFPQQNHFPDETRLTVMIGGIKNKALTEQPIEESVDIALGRLKSHLGIFASPASLHAYQARQAIPQYEIGHLDRVNSLEAAVRSISPRLSFLGNSFYGASVNDCIAKAKSFADLF